MIRLLAERYDTNSNVKLGGFRSQLQASYVSSHTTKLWYNEIVFLWMGVEHSGEGNYSCRSHNAKLFERIEHSCIRLGIKCIQTNATAVAAM